jgi:hypothetical protein
MDTPRWGFGELYLLGRTGLNYFKILAITTLELFIVSRFDHANRIGHQQLSVAFAFGVGGGTQLHRGFISDHRGGIEF